MGRYLLSGISGFLGSRIAQALIERGDKVTGIIRPDSNLYRLAPIRDQIELRTMQDLSFTDPSMGWDFVIHTACAYGRGSNSFADPVDANIAFANTLLDFAVSRGVSAFINTHTLLDRDVSVYSLTKHQFVELSDLRKGDIKVIHIAPDQFYGPGDDEKKFLAWFVRELRSGTRSIDLTDGEQVRDFLYLDDLVAAFVTVIEKIDMLKSGCVLECTTDTPRQQKQIISKIYSVVAEITEGNLPILNFGALPRRPNERPDFPFRADQLNALGWGAKMPLEEGLKATIAAMDF